MRPLAAPSPGAGFRRVSGGLAPEPAGPDKNQPLELEASTWHRADRVLVLAAGLGQVECSEEVALQIDQVLARTLRAPHGFRKAHAASPLEARRELLKSGSRACLARRVDSDSGERLVIFEAYPGGRGWAPVAVFSTPSIAALFALDLAQNAAPRKQESSSSRRFVLKLAPGVRAHRRAGLHFAAGELVEIEAAAVPSEIAADLSVLVAELEEEAEVSGGAAA